MRLLGVTVLALLALVAPAAAKTETASLGTIRAELSYTKKVDKFDLTRAFGLTLRVFDGETQIAERKIPDKKYYAPIGLNTDTKSVSVRDLDGDGIGEAVFDLYTGGAHCCEVTYLYDGATELVEEWGDPGYAFQDVDGDGREEFSTADGRFEYTFGAPYVASFPPVQVLRLQEGALIDVTREPAMAPAVRKDARAALKAYRRAARDAARDPIYRIAVKTTMAAYVADQCTLGDCDPGYAKVARAIERGALKPGYTARLRRLLFKLGYDRSASAQD